MIKIISTIKIINFLLILKSAYTYVIVTEVVGQQPIQNDHRIFIASVVKKYLDYL